MAAAALYLSARENYIGITQKEFAKTSGVSEVTLRNGVKVIKGLSLVPNN
jgi:transcription initiation factor TFIIIB Brf1 subunit/transcription initiation factor TFIIB